MTAEPCAQQALIEKDVDKVVKCALPVLDILDKYCSTAAFREACGMAPSMFADFVLNLAEVLEVGEDGYGLRGSSFGEEYANYLTVSGGSSVETRMMKRTR